MRAIGRRSHGRDPSRPPWILGVVTALYIAWTLVPIAFAIRVSFNQGFDATHPNGYTLDAYRTVLAEPDLRAPFLLSLRTAAFTALIATPLGVLMALALWRWRGRGSSATSLLVSFVVITPQVALGGTLFYVFAFVYHLRLDASAILLGHVTIAFPLVALIVRTRLHSIPREYEEMALDLGASPVDAIRRVIAPLLGPAALVGAVVAFTISFDNFVLSNWLCIFKDCRTLPTLLYGGRNSLELDPTLLALGSMGIAVTASAAIVVVLTLRAIGGAQRSWITSRALR